MSAHQMAVETQQELRRLPGNNRCVDCDAPYPQWATVSYGTFMCLECSGRHRGLGVHISFVRSVTMDSWTDKQILQMQRGGNDTFREAFAAAGVPTTLSIQQKYNTPQADAFRARLTALVEGRAAMPLPRWDPNCIKPAPGSSGSSSFAHGDTRGVEALKGESESDYVARQMRLKEEARARMAAKFGGGGMQGIGSGGETRAPANNGGGMADLSSAFGFLTTTVSTVASSAVSLVKDQDLGTKVSSGWSYVQSSLGDPALTDNVKSTATTGWSALTNATTAVWQKAVQAPPASESGLSGLNGSLAPTGKYAGVGNDQGSSSSRGHDNDSWLDAQLHSSPPPKANSFNGVSAKPSLSSSLSSAAHSSSFTSSSSTSSSSSSSFPGQSLKPTSFSPPTSSSSGTNGFSSTTTTSSSAAAVPLGGPPLPPPVPTPAPAPPKEKKKDVDFFAEFGF